MADLGITIAGKLIEVTGSAIIKEICDVWGYKSQLAELKKTVSTIKNVLLDADSKRDLSHEARSYIDELKAAVYDADDLFDEFITLAELKLLDGNKDDKFLQKVRRFFSSKKKGVSQAQRMSRQVKDIKEQLDTIFSNHHKFGLSVDYTPITRRREETCSYVNTEDIIGREDDKKVVINMLLGPNDVHESFCFVTIMGVGGLGKTALAQLVYNDKEVQAEFPDPRLRLWVCVSDQDGQELDVKVILCKILELVSDLRIDGTSTMEWVQKKFQDQLRGKKYLLVLDDVWNENPVKLRNLRKFLMLGQEGSRVLVTTRSETTAKIIGGKHIHKLQGLSPKDSWLLFESVAFDKGEQQHVINHLELVEIGKKIVIKCYNIPLAIKVVGSLLYGCTVNKWQTFEENGLAGIGNGDNEIMSILKLSYHNLRPSLKNCFSYCALFPKDVYMERKRLFGLWMAQGYIVPLDRVQSMEDAAEEHFLILVRRCFFQDVKKDEYGDIEYVKMHDLMHDVAQEVGKEEIGVASSNTTKLGDKVRHLYLARSTFSQSYSFKSKMRSFILRYDRSITLEDTRIDSLMCLRVLCFKSFGIKKLSDSIAKLLHLRYLDLSRSYDLEALSDSISGLHNLQTLVLCSCINLRELPKEFSKLVKLRYLDLSWCTKLTDVPFMDKLINLRHLNLSYCFELSSMPSGIDKLTSLRHFDLSGCERLTSMPTNMGQLTSLRHFVLSGCYRLSSMPSGMGKLTDLRVLPFFVVGKEKIVSTDEYQCSGELKDLKPLTNIKGGIYINIGENYVNDDGEGGYLKGMKYLSKVEIQSFVDGGCLECEGVMEKLEPPSNLREFMLCNYMGTTIPGWGRSEDNWAISFQHLVNIEFSSCNNLEQIPSLSKLCFLKSLCLGGLMKLEYVENKNSNNGNDREDLTTFFPSLEVLNICECESLKGWWREEELVEGDDDDRMLRISFTFPHLFKLDLVKCPKLTSFPSCPSLKTVAMDELDFLKSIDSQCLITSLLIDSNEKVESLSEFGEVFRKYTTSLQILHISCCSNLRRIGRGGLEHLTALEELRLSYNDQLSFSEDEVDGDDMPWKSLHQSLRSLKLYSLKNMKSLPEGMQYLTSLRSLTFNECENLSALPEWISCLSSLQSLSIKICRIKSLPESMRNLTSLQKLVIKHCPELKESCKQPNGKDWPNIQHIPHIQLI